MKLTSDQRQAMIGKSFTNSSFECSVTVHDVERCGGGFTVKFTRYGENDLIYVGLQRFLKHFPHKVSRHE